MKKGCLITAVMLALIVAGVIVLVAFRAGAAPSYPTTPEGWAERWKAAAAKFGRTPGENWDLWLGVLSEVEAAIAEPGGADPDRVGAALAGCWASESPRRRRTPSEPSTAWTTSLISS